MAVKLSEIVKLVVTARDENVTDAQVRRDVRRLFGIEELDLVIDEASEMSQTMVGVILEELESETEDWVLVVSPLGDSVGWRAAILVGDHQIQLAGASSPSWSEAISRAVGRTRAKLEELKNEDEEAETL